MKGQAEIIIVLAVMIILIVVATFALQIGLKTPDISSLASVFRDEVSKRLYDGSLGVVKTISAQGGLLDPRQNTVEYLGNNVPYWQVCQNKLIPSLADIRKNIKAGVENFVNKLDIKDFQGKPVTLLFKDTDVIIRNQDILITLTVETKLAGYDLDPVYEIRVPANLAELHAFASDFVEDNSVNRHLERAIIYSFFSADEKVFPTSGILTKCGESIFMTWDDIKGAADRIIKYSLGNIVFWANAMKESQYSISALNGKTYPEIGIKFSPTKLTKENFQSSVNPVSIRNSKTLHLFVPKCVKDYNVAYSLNAPVVASVGSQDYSFNFAMQPFIDNNKIGKCSVAENFSYSDDPCLVAKCDAKISVVDQDERPVVSTTVSFGSCPIGKTDGMGLVEGKIPCGISELNAYNPTYAQFADITSSKDLADTKIKMKKLPTLNIHFYRGSVYTGPEMALLGGPVEITTGQITSDSIIAIFRPKTASPWAQKEFLMSNIDFNGSVITSQLVDYLPPDNYTVEIQTFKSGQLAYLVCESELLGLSTDCDRRRADVVFLGKVNYDFNLEEGAKDVYITSLIPFLKIISNQAVDFDYTKIVPNINNCFGLVSTSQPSETCQFTLPKIVARKK